jgi:hypothetical protein
MAFLVAGGGVTPAGGKRKTNSSSTAFDEVTGGVGLLDKRGFMPTETDTVAAKPAQKVKVTGVGGGRKKSLYLKAGATAVGGL